MNSDPYETLGVRPQASQHEIDLAFKGRRSQYHPDRYQNSDKETIDWATEQMQRLNKAYAILADPKKRAAFDFIVAGARQAVAENSRPPEDESEDHRTERTEHEDAEAEVIERPSLRALLNAALAPYRGFERIYFAPNIPEKKLNAALNSYGAGTQPEDVLALVNTTVFGGAREGLFVTEKGIFAKDLASDPWHAPWEEVDVLHLQGTTANLDGRKFIECSMVDKQELQSLFTALRAFAADFHHYLQQTMDLPPRSAGWRTTEAPWTDVILCGQMHEQAIAYLQAAEEVLAPIEEQIEEALLDRELAVQFMNETVAALLEPQKAKMAYRFLEHVALLSRSICSVADGSVKTLPEDLIRHRITEPRFVNELRATLRTLIKF